MIVFRVSSILVLAPAVCLGFVAEAAAHIELTEPKARYEITGLDTGIKGCPCGIALVTGRTNRCDVEQDGSDPNRDEARASTYEAGSELTIKVDEYVGHPGRFRVAFDPDGADFNDFNDNVLLDVSDPNDGMGARELKVTLPNMACDNCTLQVIQAMDARIVDTPVVGDELANIPTYYTCIDITLTGGEGDTSDAASSDTGSDNTMTSGAESSGVASTETSDGSESSSNAGTTASLASSGPDEQTSETEATSTRPAPTSTATTTTTANATATATAQAPTTATASPTSADSTTVPSATTDDEGESGGESGCSVAFAPKPTVTLFTAFGAVALGLLLRRRRA